MCPGCKEENPAKFRLCGYCGVPLGTAAAVVVPDAAPALPMVDVRKTVTIVFTDLKGSTALAERIDPEVLRDVMDRYFRMMAAEIERHGGKIEKYIGDAIMAVFGLPRAREDDALRAIRAASGMVSALQTLNVELVRRYGITLANRTGVNTGSVIATDDPEAVQKLVTGDAVNVAARLEQMADENEVLLGESTYQLVRDAVDVLESQILRVPGKSEGVASYRLVSTGGVDGNLRRNDTPLVGRDAELALIDELHRGVVESRMPRMLTVIADAGAGKSRLAHEVVERLGAGVGARVLRGRCLSYGEGITFWPLRMVVGAAASIKEEDSPESAHEKLLALVRDPAVADRLASAAGLSATPFPLQETNWAARKLFEGLSLVGPLVLLIDDIHWAEKAFLDLLEHVLATSLDAPIFLLTTARHDLVESYPRWGVSETSTRLVLPPLSHAASAEVLDNLLGQADLSDDVRERIVRAAEGNPLYVEQVLSMLIDNGTLRLEGDRWVRADGDREIAVPPTIHALIEGRLDTLGRSERAVVGPASVIGLEFAQAALDSLVSSPLRPALDACLSTLSTRRFIHTTRTRSAEPFYRFQHQLVRDTVYRGLLKRSRANLHVAFVRWADRVNADRDRALEFEEVLGYHLEQAYRYLSELGAVDEPTALIGADAARRLSNAARRAFARGDMRAASKLFGRAVVLLPADHEGRIAMLPELAETLMGVGDFPAAQSTLDEAIAAARRAGNERVRASAQLVGMQVRLHSGEQQADWGAAALAVSHEVIPILERENAHNELANAWRLIVLARGISGQYELASDAVDRSNAHARIAGNDHLVARNGLVLSINQLYGATAVPEAIVLCEQLIAEGIRFRQVEARIVCTLAQLKAMNGELQTARALHRRGRAMLQDLGQGVPAASTALSLARIEWLGGNLAEAEREVRGDYAYLEKLGETYVRSTMAALLSRLVRDQGRDAEALALSEAAERISAADDLESQALWRSVRAPIVARAGDVANAEALATTAIRCVRLTESPALQAEVLEEAASMWHIVGNTEKAREAIVEAISLYVAKGDVVSARRAIDWSDKLEIL